MKKILVIIALLFLSSQIGWCQEEKQPLLVTVKTDKKIYAQGEQIKLSVTIKNNSPESLSICIFDIKHKLMENLIFLKEGCLSENNKVHAVATDVSPCAYRLKDWTKRKLPVVEPDDFIFLKTQEEYQIELALETVISLDSSWRYILKEKVDLQWGEGDRELSAHRYQITAKYENSIVGIGDNGEAIHAHDVQTVIVKMHNAWFGMITSNAITIEVIEGA